MNTRIFSLCAIATAVSAGLVTLAPSDAAKSPSYAVVVGIDQYPGTRAPRLSGSSKDAESFAEICRKNGMQVVLLENEAATTEAVTEALRKTPAGGTVVFYYSGYGSGPATPVLLMSNTVQPPQSQRLEKTMTLAELDKALLATKADERVAILDCCFTGSRSSKDGPSEDVVRYYRPGGGRDVMLASAADLPGVSHNKINYICASRFNEEALEVGGKGIFTDLLCQVLSTGKAANWQSVQMQVSGKLAQATDDRQHPSFSTMHLAKASFANDNTAVAVVTPSPSAGVGMGGPMFGEQVGGTPVTAYDVFSADHRDHNAMRIEIVPDRDTISVNQPIELRVKVMNPGYLVLMNHGSEGAVNLLYPRDGNVWTAGVQAGQTVQIPESNMTLSPDRPGRERVKAFLFANAKEAQEFIRAAQAANGSNYGQAASGMSRSLVFGRKDDGPDSISPSTSHKPVVVPKDQTPLTTADLSFQVIP